MNRFTQGTPSPLPKTQSGEALRDGEGAPPQMSNAMMGAQGAPQAPAAPPAPPSLEDVQQALSHVRVMVANLLKLSDLPEGKLTKPKVFEAASNMIAEGAFPTPSSKQQLIVELANLPDDEAGLRKALGTLLMDSVGHEDTLTRAEKVMTAPAPSVVPATTPQAVAPQPMGAM